MFLDFLIRFPPLQIFLNLTFEPVRRPMWTYEDLCGFQIRKNLSSELLNMDKNYDFVIKPLKK